MADRRGQCLRQKQTNPLLTTDVGLGSVVNNQGLSVNPELLGQVSFTFSNGNVAAFAGDGLALNGGCPVIRDYDGASNAGTSVVTHRYVFGATTGTGAAIMNKNADNVKKLLLAASGPIIAS